MDAEKLAVVMNHLGIARTFFTASTNTEVKEPAFAEETGRANLAAALRNSFVPPAPSLGLDLDGTIDNARDFFKILTAIWPGKVYVITYRSDRVAAIQYLRVLGVRYDELILAKTFREKGEIVAREEITVFVDDMDEVLSYVPDVTHGGQPIAVLKMRNCGNSVSAGDQRLWVYDDKTGRHLGEVCGHGHQAP